MLMVCSFPSIFRTASLMLALTAWTLNRTGHLSVHFGTVKVQCEISSVSLESSLVGFFFQLRCSTNLDRTVLFLFGGD